MHNFGSRDKLISRTDLIDLFVSVAKKTTSEVIFDYFRSWSHRKFVVVLVGLFVFTSHDHDDEWWSCFVCVSIGESLGLTKSYWYEWNSNNLALFNLSVVRVLMQYIYFLMQSCKLTVICLNKFWTKTYT